MTSASIAEVVLQLDQLSRHNQQLQDENASLRRATAAIQALDGRIGRHNEQLQDENAALRAAISAVQDLHHIDVIIRHCGHCQTVWPCPTITAINKTQP